MELGEGVSGTPGVFLEAEDACFERVSECSGRCRSTRSTNSAWEAGWAGELAEAGTGIFQAIGANAGGSFAAGATEVDPEKVTGDDSRDFAGVSVFSGPETARVETAGAVST